MKRGAGMLALITFLFTGMHFVSGSGAARSAARDKPTEAPAAESAAMRLDTTCDAFITPPETESKDKDTPPDGGEISARVDRFLYGTAAERHLGDGLLPEQIRFLIASVPDPVHTHLSLQFDRTLEAIQQAAQDEHYTYDSSWLPWRVGGSNSNGGAESAADSKRTAHREACPGVILFRHNMSRSLSKDCPPGKDGSALRGDTPYSCGMVVFVVSEQPTSGLNRMQWNNALRWIALHGSKSRADRTLRVLGPTFSGSIPSFVRALEETRTYGATFTSTLLYTGRIRGCSSWHWLKSQLNPAEVKPAPGELPVRLADFEENDAVQSQRFLRYLTDRGHRLQEVAILSEDETAYGGLPDSHSTIQECDLGYSAADRPVHLYYPRDISAIRSAYQEQSIFSAGSKDTNSQPHTVLRPEFDANARENTDSVQPFSGNNMALTQEAQLYGIVNTLKTHGTRYILLRSTNSLDYLFLTRFLRRAYPTAYIVTTGSDLLFGREVDSTEFRGVVSLSTFPLLPRGQDWTRQINAVPQHAHRIFGSYTMEGAYLATRFLFTDPGTTREEAQANTPFIHPAKADIPDYAPPFWETPIGSGTQSAPATWLAVIGRDGYWPLAVLKEPVHTALSSNLALVAKPVQGSLEQEPGFGSEKLSLSSSWRFFCVLALLALATHVFACRFGWGQQNLGMFVQFTPLEGHRAPLLISVGWAAACSLVLILFLTSYRIYPWLGGMDRGWVWATGLAVVCGLGLALIERRWWTQTPPWADTPELQQVAREQKKRLRFSPWWIFVAIALTLVFGAAVWLCLDFRSSNDTGVAMAYRSIHLTSGVSPVVSLILMVAGFYWWFWQSLSGLALMGNGRPVLPRQKRVPEGFTQISDSLGNDIDRTAIPFPWFGKGALVLYLLPLFLVILLAFVLQRAWVQSFDLVLHSLENEPFNRTLHLLVSLGLYLILFECLQFYSTWLALKRLLEALNRIPLRRTFAALQGLSMRSLWRLSGTSSRARFKVFAHQLESLLHLRNELEASGSKDTGGPSLRHAVRAAWAQGWHFVQDRSRRRDFAMVNDPEAKAIRIRFCAAAEQIIRDLLVPEWLEERTSLDLRDAPGDGKSAEKLALSESKAVQLGEEFVCMVYVGYLQNMLGRMRTMVLSMAGIFAAIALSMGFYPYTPRPTISFSLLVLLFLIGAVVGAVYAGLDRDSTLSHITDTEPGQLGAHFWLRILSFVGVPALGLIVAQFPEITDFAFSWIAPTMSAMK